MRQRCCPVRRDHLYVSDMSKAKLPVPRQDDPENVIGDRLDRALKRAFSMPPKQQESLKKKTKARAKKRK